MSSIAKQVNEVRVDGMRLFATAQKTKDLLTIEGSVLGGPTTLPRAKRAVALLTAELLDAGTITLTKQHIRKLLADKGITLSFSASGARTYFSASSLPEDLSTVLTLIIECLSSASFEEKELALAKERMLGELLEENTDTRTRAGIALSRMLYEPSHPNYASTLEETAKSIKETRRKDLVAHQKTFGRQGLVLAVVGDITPDQALALAVQVCKKLPEGSPTTKPSTEGERTHPEKEVHVSIPDKANVDTFFARTLSLNYDSTEFLPLSLAISMLGGRGLSTGHLMRTIRERDGLTYGIYGSLNGFEDATTGYWRIWGTFAPSVFTKAVLAVKEEIALFLKKGLTEKALAIKKQEVAGSYQVALSTSYGLAGALHRIGREGKAISYIDEYPELIKAVSLSEVKKVSALLVPEKLLLAAAGTFTK